MRQVDLGERIASSRNLAPRKASTMLVHDCIIARSGRMPALTTAGATN